MSYQPSPVAQGISAAGNAYAAGITAASMGQLALKDPKAYQQIVKMQFKQAMIALGVILGICVIVIILHHYYGGPGRINKCHQDSDCTYEDNLKCVKNKCVRSFDDSENVFGGVSDVPIQMQHEF